MKTSSKMIFGAGVAVLALGAFGLDRALGGGSVVQETDDAYVTADFSIVAPKVSGLIDRVLVEDNQSVHAGQMLAHIDDRDYHTAGLVAQANLEAGQADITNLNAALAHQTSVIGQARATLHADDAMLTFTRANSSRYASLSRGGAGSMEQQQQSTAQYQQAVATSERDKAVLDAADRQVDILQAQHVRAEANLKRLQAELEQAQLNLSYTRIVAPVDGVVGERAVRIGNYVNPGSALLAVVPLSSAYVLANFQETQLTNVVRGQTATIVVDSFPGHRLTGTVDSLAPASGVAFSPIAPDNATGNFTKVVQRIPVKIVLTPGQDMQQRLRVGMSAEATVDTRSSPHRADEGATNRLAAR